MKVSFIGDIHGEHAIMHDKFPPNAIQVGDLDLFGYENWRYDHGDRFFIDGNHDNFSKLNTNASEPYAIESGLVYIPRGFVSGRVMFFGGADSIDKQDRMRREAMLPYLQGRTWYWKEKITEEQLERARKNSDPIEVIVAHDVPDFVTKNMVERGKLVSFFNLDSGKQLARLFAYKKPKLWIAGHYHRSFDVEIYGCRFVCLDINEIREFDIPIGRLLDE